MVFDFFARLFGRGDEQPSEHYVYELVPFEARTDDEEEEGEGRGYYIRRVHDDKKLRWQRLPIEEGFESINIVGESFRPGEVQKPCFARGSTVWLVPEPTNPYDRYAVAVFDATRKIQCGYIPREHAKRILERMAAGEIVSCIVMWEVAVGGKRVSIRLLLLSRSARERLDMRQIETRTGD